MINSIDREKYIKKCNKLAEKVIFEEKLPFVTDIMDFALNDKVSDRLDHMFEFFDNKEELENLVKRESLSFSEEEGNEFIDTVISANLTDIRVAGSLYKQLQATGDDLRIKGENCKSEGREIELPISEEEFLYNVRNSFVYFDDKKDLTVFHNYDEFIKGIKGKDKIYVRTPLTCKHANKRGICKTCAGQIPPDTQNIGAFSTLMVTEFATQSALSSMNKGTKENVNTLLTKNDCKAKVWEDFVPWAEDILVNLEGKEVERRFYEIVLIGRVRYNKDKMTVSSLQTPNSKNYLGAFIYRPREVTYRNMISNAPFTDNSLKVQIATNDFRKGMY